MALAAATTTTVPHREVTPAAGSEPAAATNWQIWAILLAVSALTGLAVKLVSDPARND